MRLPRLVSTTASGVAAGWVLSVCVALVLMQGCVSVPAGQRPTQEWIQLSKDGHLFVQAPSLHPWTPWGFNYDHDDSPKERLIDDAWDWRRIERDFKTMRGLGATVVRVQLQLGRFMRGPNQVDPAALVQLRRLLDLAESVGVYLDITGLGTYRAAEVPPWYDALPEAERWATQARFWEAVAATAAGSPAVFCFNLMGEPAVPADAQPTWLPAPWNNEHSNVEFIVLDPGQRRPADIARAWLRKLIRAIREQDATHLITVGSFLVFDQADMLPLGLNPHELASEVDFVSAHLYPTERHIDVARQELDSLADGKPLLIEEASPRTCPVTDLQTLIEESRGQVAGWLGFFRGKTVDDYRGSNRADDVLAASWIDLLQRMSPLAPPQLRPPPLSSPSSEVEHIAASCTLNGDDVGQVFTTREGTHFYVSAADLDRAGVELAALPPAALKARKEEVDLTALGPNVHWSFEQKGVNLTLSFPAGWLKPSRINLARSLRPDGIVYTKNATAFLNYSLGAENTQLTFAGEAGVSVLGALAYSSFTAGYKVFTADHDLQYLRGISNITFNRPDSLMQIVVGDSLSSTGALGGSTYVGGLHFLRNFQLDPYFIRFPTFSYAGSLLSPSTVDVYVNGTLVKHMVLPPGPFSLNNLQLSPGAGQTNIVITDAFGRQQQLGGNYYVATTILGKGVSEYDYSIGFPRDNVGTNSGDYLPPVAMGHHLYGFTDSFTGGFRFESGIYHTADSQALFASGGLLAAGSIPFGQISGAVAASIDQARAGGAGILSYSFLVRYLSIGLFGQLTSPSYATASLRAVDDRNVYEAGGSIGTTFLSRVSLSANASWAMDRDKGLNYTFGAVGTVRITNAVYLSVTGTRELPLAGTPDYQVFASLNIMLGKQTAVQVGAQYDAGATTWTAGVSSAAPYLGSGFGYNVQTSIPQQGEGPLLNRDDTTALAIYQGPYGRYQAGFEHTDGQFQPQGEISGSLVLIGGHLFAAKPVDQGFGLIQVPGVSDVRGYINNQLVGRTDSNGNLLIPTTLPYFANRFSLADADIPQGVQLDGPSEQLLAPPTRGGSVARFDYKRILVVRGTVKVIAGEKSIIPVYGELTVTGLPYQGDARFTSEGALGAEEKIGVALGHNASSPIGTSGEFELPDLVAGTYDAEITYRRSTCRFRLTVPKTRETFLKLGELRCIQQ